MLKTLPIALCLVSVLPAVRADGPKDSDQYSALLIDGKKVGHSHTTQKRQGKQVVSSEDMTLQIGRAGMVIRVREKQEYVETLDGKPLRFLLHGESGIAGGSMTGQDLIGTIAADGTMTVKISAGGRTVERKMTYPAGALMTYGLKLLDKAKRKEGVKRYTCRIFDPSTQSAMTAECVTVGPATIEWFGKKVETTRQDVVLTSPTGAKTRVETYVDEKGDPVRAILPMAGMTIELLRCDKAYALSPVENVDDFMAKFLVSSPKAIPPDASKAIYTLKPKGDAKLAIPNRWTQKVETLPDGRIRLTVTRKDRGPLKPLAPDKKEIAEALKPTALVESDAKEIKDLSAKAVGGATENLDKAIVVEKFVSGYVKHKNLSVASGSALQTARSRQGDCSEHAALTAGLLRAAGVPTRLVHGLAFAEKWDGQQNVFVPHMWVEACCNGHWLPFDAALLPKRKPGVGRIVLATGETDGLLDLVNSIGGFEIETVEIGK